MQLLLFSSGLIGFLAVALGAFGAHALKGQLSAEAAAWQQTATLYALVHAVAALGVALAARNALTPMMTSAGWAFVIGVIIFSGSLYAMALGAPRWLGAITPLGGLSLLVGWALIAIFALRRA